MKSSFDHEFAIELVQKIEQGFDVSSLVFRGVKLWPIVRMQIYNENLSLTSIHGDDANFTKLKFYLKRITSNSRVLLESFVDRKNALKAPDQAPIYLSSHSTSRISKVDGKWHDFICSPLQEWVKAYNSDLNIYFEESLPSGEYRIPRYEATDYVTTDLLLCFLKGTLIPCDLPPDLMNVLHEIRSFMTSIGARSESISVKRLSRRLSAFFAIRKYYRNKLVRFNSKLVIVVAYYSLRGMALMQAASDLEITTVDVQHGVQGDKHVAYSEWPAMSDGRFGCLPTCFWCWTDADVDNINMWSNGKYRVFRGGNVQSYYWKNKVHPDFPHLLKKTRFLNPEKIILITLQPGLDNFLSDCIDIIATLDVKYYWLIRIHPSMQSLIHKTSALFERFHNVDVDYATTVPLDNILTLATHHITMWSSATIEASMRGVPTFVGTPCCAFFDAMENQDLLVIRNENENLIQGVERFLCMSFLRSKSELNDDFQSTLKSLISEVTA
jgi:hypothetical protein